MALANPPSLDILVRDSCTFTKFSDDGSKLMVIRSNSVITIYDSNNLVEIRALQVPNLLAASISLCGTYVQTIQKSASPQIKNEKGRPLPKFGEWDVNDPTSAEGFTVIFNKARDEKKTGGKPTNYGGYKYKLWRSRTYKTSGCEVMCVSFVYERGWRQNFNRSGFPGPDKEVASAKTKVWLEYVSVLWSCRVIYNFLEANKE